MILLVTIPEHQQETPQILSRIQEPGANCSRVTIHGY